MKNKSKTIGMILGILHLSLVIFIVFNILSGKEPDWPMYWLLLIPFDLPVLLLQYLTNGIIEPVFSILASNFTDTSPLSSSNNFWMPLFYYGLLGTVLWYFIPTIIAKVINMIKKQT